MYTFGLDAGTTERLAAQFRLFTADRERVRALLDPYLADYRAFNGTALARYEYLREKYKPLAPNLTHLVYDEDGEIYWSAADVSIILDRDSTSITRTLGRIERTGNWRSMLYTLRKLVDPKHVPPVYAYKKGVFDFIIDFYEEEYLQRFVTPRRGKAIAEEEAAEIYRFWKHLKSQSSAGKEIFSETGAAKETVEPQAAELKTAELPDIPPMSLREIVRLIADKLFTIKMGAFFTVLLASGYELSRRWNGFYLWLPALSVLVFTACALLIHKRKFNPGHLANIGASALLLCLLWFVGLLAQDGGYADGQSSFLPFKNQEDPKMVLNPMQRDDSFYFNIAVENMPQNVKEFFYRIKPGTEYRSAGFMPEINPATGLPYPNMTIPNEKNGIIEIDVKYTDFRGGERGPYNFRFDSEQLDLTAAKYFTLNYVKDWVRIFSIGIPEEETLIRLDDSLFSASARDTIVKVMYGVNKETPDTVFDVLYHKNKPITQMGEDRWTILKSKEDIQYVSAQIFFKDGTSTDVRMSELRSN